MAKKPIPTKQITTKVQQFLDGNSLNETLVETKNSDINVDNALNPKKAKGRSISMTDEFDKNINQFLRDFPDEGSRSQLIQRAVNFYMKKRRHEEKQFVVQ